MYILSLVEMHQARWNLHTAYLDLVEIILQRSTHAKVHHITSVVIPMVFIWIVSFFTLILVPCYGKRTNG